MDRDRRKWWSGRATNVYKMNQLIFPFDNTGTAFSAIPCIWFVFSSKEHFCHLILIADPAQWGACFTTETNAWVFAWQELCTWLIARFPVTQLIAQLSATMVDARPFAWFLQQQYKSGWFMWWYLVLQFNVLHNKMCHFKDCYHRSGRTEKYLERLCECRLLPTLMTTWKGIRSKQYSTILNVFIMNHGVAMQLYSVSHHYSTQKIYSLYLHTISDILLSSDHQWRKT